MMILSSVNQLQMKTNLFVWIFCLIQSSCEYEFHYHSYLQMTNFLHNITAQYPSRSALFQVGETQGSNFEKVPIEIDEIFAFDLFKEEFFGLLL